MEKNVKIIIAGGRDFKDYNLLKSTCDSFFEYAKGFHIEIVSGGQVTTDKETGEKYGADYLGEQYAKEKGFKINRFPADWQHYGKSAGYKRNEIMARYADGLIAFWDGKSKGTGHMIDLAKKYNLKIKIINYDNDN